MRKVIFLVSLISTYASIIFSQIISVSNDGRIVSDIPVDLKGSITCQLASAANIPAKEEILKKIQSTLKIFNDPKNHNYIFLKKMNSQKTDELKDEYFKLAENLRNGKAIRGTKLKFLRELIVSDHFEIDSRVTKDTLNIIFKNSYKGRLQSEYIQFKSIGDMNEKAISNILNSAHLKLEKVKQFLKTIEKILSEEDVTQIKKLLGEEVQIPESIQEWIITWLWVNEGAPTINPVYSAEESNSAILKEYFFLNSEILVNKLIIVNGLEKQDFFSKRTETQTIYKNNAFDTLLIYNTPRQYTNVVRTSFDTLSSQSEFQQSISQFAINFQSIAGVIGAKTGTFFDGVFQVRRKNQEPNYSYFANSIKKSESTFITKDENNLQNRLREDSIYLEILIRVLGEPLPNLIETKNDTKPLFYTSLVELPAVEKPGKHIITVKGISQTDSVSIFKNVIKYKKKNSFDVSIGLAYTIPNHHYYVYNGDNATPTRVYQQHIRLLTGIHWYPWKIDMSSNRFIGKWKERTSIFGGVGVPNPLNNLYLGLSYDLIPGLKLSAGCHWTRYNKLNIVNDKIQIEDDYKLKLLFPYIGIQFSPVSAITPILTTLGL